MITAWILGDQLLADHPAVTAGLESGGREEITLLLIESQQLLNRRRYHRKKICLLLSAMRHYADEMRKRGFKVNYLKANDMLSGLRQHFEDTESQALYTMAASHFAGRQFQENLSQRIGVPVTIVPDQQFLRPRVEYEPEVKPGSRLTHESFYRQMRTRLDLLLTDEGDPEQGQWNFDEQNREPLPEQLSTPPTINFEPDEITTQVMQDIDHLPDLHGSIADFDLAVTRDQAEQAAAHFFEHRLAKFGTYEDAMSSEDNLLFHSKLSPYLNIGLLDPLDLARQAEVRYYDGKAPINSVEGFIRQLIGWREFIYWQYWRTMPAVFEKNYFKASRALPDFFWTASSEMNCLAHVIERAQKHGYNHHIERLMVLSNYCLLTGVDPIKVFDWFMANYIDAYEWVMVPNVLGMGLFADGGLTSTKPYAASANYINKMSDFCEGCRYYRTKRTGENACPFNALYWNFMIDHESLLRENPRMGTSLLGLRHFDESERDEISHTANRHLEEFH